MKTIGIAVIACGDSYFEYAQILIKSIDLKVEIGGNIRVYVMTDQPIVKISNPSNIEVVYINIPKLQWPEATLLRYRLISRHLSHENLTHIFYMDADLEVIDFINGSDIPLDRSLFCVAHPGYYNRGLIFDLVRKIYYPPWETSSKFACALNVFKRKIYVAGGFWGGTKTEVLALCEALAKLTERDMSLGLYPRSYDESYLNWWVANNKGIVILTPIFLFAEQFLWLTNLSRPRILAVTKDQKLVDKKNLRDKIYKGEARKRF